MDGMNFHKSVSFIDCPKTKLIVITKYINFSLSLSLSHTHSISLSMYLCIYLSIHLPWYFYPSLINRCHIHLCE